MNRSERILRYLDGEMSGEELKAFREELEQDPELRNELDLHGVIDRALQNRREEQFRSKLERSYADYQDNKINSKKRTWKWPGSIYFLSAIAAVFFVAVFFIQKDRAINEKSLFDRYYTPLELGFSTRSFQNKHGNEDLVQGIQYYLEKDYLNSKLNFERYLSRYTKDSLFVCTILGISNLELGDYKEAEKNFEYVSYSSFSYYREHCRWYLGLTYLVSGKLKKAEKVFSDFSVNNSVYSERAGEILKKIPSNK